MQRLAILWVRGLNLIIVSERILSCLRLNRILQMIRFVPWRLLIGFYAAQAMIWRRLCKAGVVVILILKGRMGCVFGIGFIAMFPNLIIVWAMVRRCVCRRWVGHLMIWQRLWNMPNVRQPSRIIILKALQAHKQRQRQFFGRVRDMIKTIFVSKLPRNLLMI